jgi:hypothetical protein
MSMGRKFSNLGLFAICLFIFVLLQGCSTTVNPQNTSPGAIPNPGQTESNLDGNLTAANSSSSSPAGNSTLYQPKFIPGDIISAPEDEVGTNLAPDSGTVIYGRWIQDISSDNESIPIYNFKLIYMNETGQWYYTGYSGWKYSAWVDQVDNATLLVHIDR